MFTLPTRVHTHYASDVCNRTKNLRSLFINPVSLENVRVIDSICTSSIIMYVTRCTPFRSRIAFTVVNLYNLRGYTSVKTIIPKSIRVFFFYVQQASDVAYEVNGIIISAHSAFNGKKSYTGLIIYPTGLLQ